MMGSVVFGFLDPKRPEKQSTQINVTNTKRKNLMYVSLNYGEIG